MSTLTIILIVVAALIALPFILAIFKPKEMRVARTITIHKPVGEVFDFVKYMRNGEKYNKWVMADPNSKKTFTGTDGTIGAIYTWDSENKQVGKGAQEIIAIEENKRIDYELRFEKPFKNTAYGAMATEAAGPGQTNVTYSFRGDSAYMMRVMQTVFNIANILGKEMNITLNNLKTLLENN